MSLARIRKCAPPRQQWRQLAVAMSTATTTSVPKNAPLQTPEDWSEMQYDRGVQKLFMDRFEKFGSTQTRENTWQPHHPLHRPPAPGQLTLSALIASGAHFGHSPSLLNSNFIPYAYGTRAGVTVIDLDQTLPLLRRAANLTRAVAARGGTVVFLGSRPDVRGAVKKAAERMGDQQSYYVGEKWLPGTLTNRLHLFGPRILNRTRVIPDLMVILNPLQNMPAIRECAIEHIPTIGIIDSNVDPRIVMYPIPANDESTRTAEVISGVLSIAGREGVELWKLEESNRATEKRNYETRRRERQRREAEDENYQIGPNGAPGL